MMNAGLLNFMSKEPHEMLLELYRIRQRILLGEDIELPLITLLLSPEGNQVSGFLLDVKSEKQEHHLVIQLGGTRTTNDLFFAYMSAVRGVVIHDIDQYEHILTDVSLISKPNKLPITTKMDVRKKLESESNSLSGKLGTQILFVSDSEFSSDPLELFIFSNLITDVGMSLKHIAENELGKNAIINSIKQIRFSIQPTDIIPSLEGTELLIQGHFNHSFSTKTGRNKLRKMIEELL